MKYIDNDGPYESTATSWNRKVFWRFRALEKRCIGKKWLKSKIPIKNESSIKNGIKPDDFIKRCSWCLRFIESRKVKYRCLYSMKLNATKQELKHIYLLLNIRNLAKKFQSFHFFWILFLPRTVQNFQIPNTTSLIRAFTYENWWRRYIKSQ